MCWASGAKAAEPIDVTVYEELMTETTHEPLPPMNVYEELMTETTHEPVPPMNVYKELMTETTHEPVPPMNVYEMMPAVDGSRLLWAQ